MATRCTITLRHTGRFRKKSVDLYRHWDGYPEATGRHLARVARDATRIEDIAAALLAAKEGEGFGSGRYEITDRADMHGDTEWHYEVAMAPNEMPMVHVSHREIGADRFTMDFAGDLSVFRIEMAHRFRAFITRIRRMMKERAA